MPRPSRLGPSAVETVPVLVAIRLTIVFACSAGRPAGLNLTNDEELHSLLADIEAWKSNLPADLQFRGADTPRSAGTSALFEPIGARSAWAWPDGWSGGIAPDACRCRCACRGAESGSMPLLGCY